VLGRRPLLPPPACGGGRRGQAECRRPTPRHPARRTLESTVGLLARGSLPGTAFPGFPQWLCGMGSPLTVAGAAAALETGSVSAPHSLLSLCRETVDRRHLTVAAHRLSMHSSKVSRGLISSGIDRDPSVVIPGRGLLPASPHFITPVWDGTARIGVIDSGLAQEHAPE
jgi:hypothetical protein